VSDFSSIIVHKTAELLTTCKAVEKKLEGYLETKMERPDIAYELLKMFMIIDELLEYVEPSKTIGEIHGLPKDAVFGAKKPLVFSNEEGWDFRPWFGEKVSMVRNGLKELYKYWETDPTTVKLVENAPMTPIEWVKDGIFSGLNQVKTYAQTIFEMTCNDKIIIESKND
jgi:hypothetical protein